MKQVIITGNNLTLKDFYNVSFRDYAVSIDPIATERMARSSLSIEKIIEQGQTVYGVNTGFGKLSNVHIPVEELGDLQKNLVLSHACGTGDYIPKFLSRAILLLKANALCKGFSGTRPEIAHLLINLLNNDIIPAIPEKGSVGASGDLAPLAHMTLVLIGLGEAWSGNNLLDGRAALNKIGLTPIQLRSKEGLALLNGTQFMTAFAVAALIRAKNLLKCADIAGAITVESLLGTKTAFDDRIQKARGYEGQIHVARNMRKLLEKSEIVESHKNCEKVQDAYSTRCIPQVHGAVRQAIEFVEKILLTEMNACTDNPLIFSEDFAVLSGGNFHGQPISLASDYLTIAVAQLANMSERRIESLMDPVQSGLPPFLAPHSGINSGFMIAQVTAASLVSENKVYSHPASVDSIPTSANQEDFVSMGAHAARKALEVIENSEVVIGIELLAGCQAIDFRKNLQPGLGTFCAHKTIREYIPEMDIDRLIHKDIEEIKKLVKSNVIVNKVEAAIGSL